MNLVTVGELLPKRHIPRKKKGQALGRRVISGELLDCKAVSEFLGVSQKQVRARTARHQLPFRRWGGRVVFLRSDILEFLNGLPGCSIGEAAENSIRLSNPEEAA